MNNINEEGVIDSKYIESIRIPIINQTSITQVNETFMTVTTVDNTGSQVYPNTVTYSDDFKIITITFVTAFTGTLILK
jgi:hypothetical protein